MERQRSAGRVSTPSLQPPKNVPAHVETCLLVPLEAATKKPRKRSCQSVLPQLLLGLACSPHLTAAWNELDVLN